MNFGLIDGRYSVARITGPTHNLLGLRVSTQPATGVTIVKLPPVGACRHGSVDEALLQAAVAAGVEAANRECGTGWHVVEIAYVEDDTPSYSQYEICANALIKRLASGEPFPEWRPPRP